jgi:hypothetical protein
MLREVVMKLDRLQDALSCMSDKALIRFIKRLACKAMFGQGDDPSGEARSALDMVYLECSRRGKERLYDSAYAWVQTHPDSCRIR